jgi:hypothetical protein
MVFLSQMGDVLGSPVVMHLAWKAKYLDAIFAKMHSFPI